MCQTCFQHAANGTGTKQMNYVTNNYESYQWTKQQLQLVTKQQGSLNDPIWVTSLTIHLSSRTLGKTAFTTAETREEMIFLCK